MQDDENKNGCAEYYPNFQDVILPKDVTEFLYVRNIPTFD